jgi:hypothetical protein
MAITGEHCAGESTVVLAGGPLGDCHPIIFR